ncbi:PREDICTED: BRCA1-A complex subunit BRE-like isoform X2 [Priapulus caudatus]|uniref:BRISC and BRCA1-A complex member 2 n=1 Tax=Priapulus caudatus TaxID=37621 RepID=A0ABM1E493_PRICU|nr:PREDICTED: BRCA1-A complex subunit BRE-like isoform X2 [Priapulus caudatus]
MGIDVVDVFDESVVKFVEALVKDGRFGICGGSIRIFDYSKGSPEGERYKSDRFKMVLPYAGQSIVWEILFNAVTPELPPDFIFNEQEFFPDPDKLESLGNWNSHNPSALLSVVRELLEQYREYQVSLITKDSRLHFEYQSLLERFCKKADEVEIHVTPKLPGKTGQVNFLIKLPVDFSRIPPSLLDQSTCKDSAVLLVQFTSSEPKQATPQLFLSPGVERALAGSQALRIPTFPTGGCLHDYVASVRDLLNATVKKVVQRYEKRKEYMAAFLILFGSSVLEYDIMLFDRLSMLFEWHNFSFIVHVNIPEKFPAMKPTLTLESVYHEFNKEIFSISYDDYPYSPRWHGTEMAERAREFILKTVPEFQKSSVRKGHL